MSSREGLGEGEPRVALSLNWMRLPGAESCIDAGASPGRRASPGAPGLRQEREVVAVQALAKLRRFDAARTRAKRFLDDHPESPYAKDILQLAGGAAPR